MSHEIREDFVGDYGGNRRISPLRNEDRLRKREKERERERVRGFTNENKKYS